MTKKLKQKHILPILIIYNVQLKKEIKMDSFFLLL